MAALRRHPKLATVLGAILAVAALAILLPYPFMKEAEGAGNPFQALESKLNTLQSSVDSLADDVAALTSCDLDDQLEDHHDEVVSKLGVLGNSLDNHDDTLADVASALDSHDDKLDDHIADGDGESAACCPWSKQLDDDDRWEDVLPYVELDTAGSPVTKYAGALDRETGLVWTVTASLVDDYNDAVITAAEHVTKDGTCGWRVATADEFATLLVKDTSDRLQLTTGGPFGWPSFGYDDTWFWTGTEFVASDAGRRVVWARFLDAAGSPEWVAEDRAYDDDSGDGYVLLVRGPGGMQH